MKTNDNKFSTFFSDLFIVRPHWSRRIVKSKTMLFFSILFPMLAIIGSLISIYEKTSKEFFTNNFFGIFYIIFVFGCLFPTWYLYAIYRLNKIIDSNCPHCGNPIAPAGKPTLHPFIGLVIAIIVVVLLYILMRNIFHLH